MMNGKLVETSLGCLDVANETVVEMMRCPELPFLQLFQKYL